MPPTAPKTDTPAEIAAALAPLVQADLGTVMLLVAGVCKHVRTTSPERLPSLKPGSDALRIESEKWRNAYLAAKREGQNGSDPTAALLAVGAAMVTTPDGTEG